MSVYMSSTGGISGLASGVDWREIIDGLLAVEQKPILSLQQKEASLNARLTALRDINSLALSLKEKAFNLTLQANLLARKTDVSGTAVQAFASPEAALGSHQVVVYRLATPTRVSSTTFLGREVEVSVPLSESGMSVTPTTGFFTINGVRINIDSSTTLGSGSNSILELINGAGLGITASLERDSQGRYNLLKLYRPEGSIQLGSGADTSNFLQAAKLYGTDPRSTWTSGTMEGSVEGTIAGDVSPDVRITFTYGGINYQTEAGAIAAATAGVTTLNEVALNLQQAINASLAGVGSVTVSVSDPAGTGNGRLIITDDLTGGSVSVVSLSGTVTAGLDPLVAANGATQGETIVSYSNLGTAVAGNYLYNARLSNALQDSWLSGYLESSSTAGKAGFDLAGTETVTFSYHGTIYQTEALQAVTAGVTDLTAVAADLESKMNARLGAAGSVRVSVYDPEGTGNARLVISDLNPVESQEPSLLFTSAPDGMRLTASTGGTAKGLLVINGVGITYDKYRDTLNGLLTRINSSGAGVKASYDTVRDAVVLTAVQTGSASVYLEDVGGNILEALNLTSPGAQQPGTNALFSVNTVAGGRELTSAGNTVSGIIPGVTLHLKEVSPRDDLGSYQSTTVTVEQDITKALGVVKDFIQSYNNLVSKLAEYTKYDPESKATGVLNGLSQARDLLRRLRSMVGYAAEGLEGYPRTLGELGISRGRSGTDIEQLLSGQLVLDEAKLTSALQQDPERVFAILGGYQGAVTLRSGGTGSIASASGRPKGQSGAGTYRIVSDELGNLTAYFTPDGGSEELLGTGSIRAGGSNSTLIPGVTLYARSTLQAGTDYLEKSDNLTGVIKSVEIYLAEITRSGGLLETVENRLEKDIQDIQEQVERMEERLDAYEARLIRQYTAMETLLSQMMSQSQWLANQVSILNRNWMGRR